MNTTITNISGNLTQRTLQEQNRTQEEIHNYLEKLNHDTVIKLIPLLVIIIVLIVVGICGNLLVFLVYLKQSKASAKRVFVLAMSVCDFLTNIFTLTWLIPEIRYIYTSKEFACKLLRFLRTFPIVMSFLILVCVALDRRRRICQVHKRQLSARQATYLLIIPFILTSCFVPSFAFLYGVKHLETDLSGVTGITCGYANTYFGRKIKRALGIVIGISFSVGYALLIASYAHISYIICQQKKKRVPVGQVNIVATSQVMKTHPTQWNMDGKEDLQSETDENTFAGNVKVDENPVDFSGHEERTRQVTWTIERDEREDNADICSRGSNLQDTAGVNVSEKEVQSRSAKTVASTSVVERLAASSADSAGPGPDTPRSSDSRSQEAKKNRHKRALLSKTTCLMLTLTVTAVVCYLPFLGVMLAEPTYHLSSLQLSLYFIGRCFPFINSVINPFVYSFCNPKFRLECRRLLVKAGSNLFPHM